MIRGKRRNGKEPKLRELEVRSSGRLVVLTIMGE